jgi:EAL domain-containing protein (putative c-di-GMP-specific phosphodiesterase class I)
MARALRLEVVAEGVETEAQRAFLERSGCDHCQGFLFAPALDVPAFERSLRERNGAAAQAAVVTSSVLVG